MKKLTLTIFTLLLLSLTFVSCANNDATRDDNTPPDDDMEYLTIADLANWDDNATWSGTSSSSWTGDKEFFKKVYFLEDEDLVIPDTPIVNEAEEYSPLQLYMCLVFTGIENTITEDDVSKTPQKYKLTTDAIGSTQKYDFIIKVNQDKTKLYFQKKVTIKDPKTGESFILTGIDNVTKD